MDDEVKETLSKSRKYKIEIDTMWEQMRESFGIDK